MIGNVYYILIIIYFNNKLSVYIFVVAVILEIFHRLYNITTINSYKLINLIEKKFNII